MTFMYVFILLLVLQEYYRVKFAREADRKFSHSRGAWTYYMCSPPGGYAMGGLLDLSQEEREFLARVPTWPTFAALASFLVLVWPGKLLSLI